MKSLLCRISLVLLVTGSAQAAESLSVRLQKAIFAEETEGNLEAAIQIYQEIARETEANRSVAAQAQFRLGMCHLKQGKKDEAALEFRKLIERFPKEADLISKSRAQLSELGLPPASVLVQQIWTTSEASLGTVSSDGRYLAFIDWRTGDVALRDLKASQNRRLTNKGNWSESPEYGLFPVIARDGQRIACQWLNRDGRRDLRVVSVQKPELRVVFTEHSEWCQPEDWSPDGRHLAALIQQKGDHEYQAVLIEIENGSWRVLKSFGKQSPSRLRFHPDGNRLALGCVAAAGSQDQDIFLLNLKDGQMAPAVRHAADDELIGWSTDGQNLLFTSNRRGSVDLWSIRISNGLAVGEPSILRADVGSIHPMGITDTGALYYDTSVNSTDLYAASVDFATGKLAAAPQKIPERFQGFNKSVRLPFNGYLLSADDRWLASIRQRGPNETLHVLNLEDGQEREFGNLPRAEWHNPPVWLPDNRTLLCRSLGFDQRIHLYLFDTVTGETQTVARDEAELRIEYLGGFSTDAQAVHYVQRSLGRFVLVRYDLQSGTKTAKETALKSNPDASYWFGLSHDREFLFYTQTAEKEPGEKSTVVARLHLQTDKQLELMRTENPVEARLNASQLALKTYDDMDNRTVRFLDLTAEPPRDQFAVLLPKRSRLHWWVLGGRYLLVTSLVGEPADYQVQLWTLSCETGALNQTGLSMRAMGIAGVRADATKLYFHAQGPELKEVWVMENFLPQVASAK